MIAVYRLLGFLTFHENFLFLVRPLSFNLGTSTFAYVYKLISKEAQQRSIHLPQEVKLAWIFGSELKSDKTRMYSWGSHTKIGFFL
jgi:hypothetical protein